MARYLAYQYQDCGLTLEEGVHVYHQHLRDNNKKILNGPIMKGHDYIHVVFGLNTAMEQEMLNDIWTFFGTNISWKEFRSYFDYPELRELGMKILKEFGVFGVIRLYINALPAVKEVWKRTRKMHKKWPYNCPNEFTSKTISDLRIEFGIKIFTEVELNELKKIEWSGSFTA